MKFKVKQKSTNMKTNLNRAYNERQEFLMTSLRKKSDPRFLKKILIFAKDVLMTAPFQPLKVFLSHIFKVKRNSIKLLKHC